MDDQTRQCPQCKGTVSQNAQECPVCGIIFEKYYKVTRTQQTESDKKINTSQMGKRNIEEFNQANFSCKQIIKKLPRSFSEIVDIYLSFNIWGKLFFGYMLFIWLSSTSRGLIVRSEWHLYDIFFIPLIIALQGTILLVAPYLGVIFIKYIQENYPEESVSYKYFAFKGAIQRLDYFIGTLVLESLIIVAILLIPLLNTFILTLFSSKFGVYTSFICLLIFILVVSVLLCSLVLVLISLKRITDIGRSRWLALMFLIPGVNLIFQIALYFIPSKNNKISIPKINDYKECPECAESVLIKAQKCRFCGHRFDENKYK
jgi:uncharacterized membrane protein YhaH (DUF805 family)/predicted RNA-binding Zn-ribbon protein involved in translation (DUF1610 family)